MSVPFVRAERAPVLLIFGEHAARMASLVRLRPSLLTRIAFAPPSAIHAIGAFLHLAPQAYRPDPELAAMLDDSDPRDLLRAAIPNAPAQLYRAMERAGERVRESQFYERLAHVCARPVVDLLWGDHPINPALLDFAETVMQLDPAVLRLRHILCRSVINAGRLDTTIRFLRAHGVLVDNDLVLPPQAGLPALAKRLSAVVDRIEAPDPGFELKLPLRLIRTVGELRATGKAMHNCLAEFGSYGSDYPCQLASGSAVFVACDDPQFVATLTSLAPGLWQFGHLTGPQNQLLDRSVTDAFDRGLRDAGVSLVKEPVSWSLNWMLHPERTGRRRGLAALADPDGNHLDDELAA